MDIKALAIQFIWSRPLILLRNRVLGPFTSVSSNTCSLHLLLKYLCLCRV